MINSYTLEHTFLVREVLSELIPEIRAKLLAICRVPLPSDAQLEEITQYNIQIVSQIPSVRDITAYVGNNLWSPHIIISTPIMGGSQESTVIVNEVYVTGPVKYSMVCETTEDEQSLTVDHHWFRQVELAMGENDNLQLTFDSQVDDSTVDFQVYLNPLEAICYYDELIESLEVVKELYPSPSEMALAYVHHVVDSLPPNQAVAYLLCSVETCIQSTVKLGSLYDNDFPKLISEMMDSIKGIF
jgi:hypothetical protein